METPLEDILARIYQEQDESDLFDESHADWCTEPVRERPRVDAEKAAVD
jgi:hypothetical protein